MNNSNEKYIPDARIIKKGSMFFVSPTIPNRLLHFRDGMTTILCSAGGLHDSRNTLVDVRRISKRKAAQIFKKMGLSFRVVKN